MDGHIISFLQKLGKPEQSFINDKECLICLEPFDLEANQIVMLPCVCSNSVYHIDCVLKLINSGQDKNFCPHCKTKYEISLPANQIQQNVRSNQIVPYIQPNLQIENPNQTQIRDLQLKNFKHILLVHFLSNSTMNVINIVVTGSCPDYNRNYNLHVSILFNYFKLFINFCMLMYLKNNITQINPCLTYTYIFQIVLFGLLIYSLASMKSDIYFIILIVNNVVLGVVIWRFE